MADLKLDADYGNVVRHNAICYILDRVEAGVADFAGPPEGINFDDCDECHNAPFPPMSLVTLEQTGVLVEGDPLGQLVGNFVITGGKFPFTIALIVGVDDDDNAHYQINGNDLELSNTGGTVTPSSSIRVEVTDALGNKLESVITVIVAPILGTKTITLTPGDNLFDYDFNEPVGTLN
jgi:hypothetical protein